MWRNSSVGTAPVISIKYEGHRVESYSSFSLFTQNLFLTTLSVSLVVYYLMFRR